MPPLNSGLRASLEKAIVEARDQAEQASEIALHTVAVDEQRPFQSMTKDQRELRNALRERGRQLGSGEQRTGFPLLVEEIAYAQWHRMFFARFLAENNLLLHPDARVAVSLEECEELATEEGDLNRWITAARYASGMLPGIFHRDDPSVNVQFAPEGRLALEKILASIPKSVFESDDGLGWVYQFWQSKRKKEVSASGKKIEKLDLAAYSQLFTEDYMVRFLLENSLGAWWAARHPDSPLVKEFQYLRFREDGTPAPGTFQDWPERAANVTVMDPCCGSAHFLVVAFEMLRRMRMEEECLSDAEAANAVIRDNVHGLEIDPRCVQIAAFALALAAWKAGGFHELPLPNVACSGIPVQGQLEAWKKLAAGDGNMERTLERLHGLFVNAPDLGSLVDPTTVPVRERMFAPDLGKASTLLQDALSKETADDPVAAVFGSAALGAARAAELLARQYTLVATNVPYLVRGKQGDVLRDFIEVNHKEAKADLATAFLERCRSFCQPNGAYAVVTPQNWTFLKSYRKFRERMLREQTCCLLARLGEGAFESNAAAGAFVSLLIVRDLVPAGSHEIKGTDASEPRNVREKESHLRTATISSTGQMSQLGNPDARISLATDRNTALLEKHAHSYQGIATADYARFGRCFWELSNLPPEWEFQQSTVKTTVSHGGREHVFLWEKGSGLLAKSPQARVQGLEALRKQGVAVSQMRTLPCTLYCGDYFDNNTAVIVPEDPIYLPAIWAFCTSPEFNTAVRQIDPKVNVTNATLVKVPFDFDHWQSVAEEQWPGGLPAPYSADPTQWPFQGNPLESTEPLQVAIARLLGYQWPQQEADRLFRLAIPDGILPLTPVAGQEPAVERLRRVLDLSYGNDWSAEQQTQLLLQVGFAEKGLDAWLRDGFFEQHCKIFHQRPFIWHIWDGRRDGFSALVNYHKMDTANLDKLIYTYLGDWVRTQQSAEDSGTPGANARLVAALELQKKLEAIRDGEDPYDIYVRWKPPHEQPIGWNPDLNDGVRVNIRPFVTAGILRTKVKVNWNKDRGHDPDGSERTNNLHLGLADKRAARDAVKA